MEQHTLGNLLFLSSLASLSVGCAAGSESGGPRPGPFMTSDGSDPGDPWTDPLETSGPESGTSGTPGDDGADEGGWPSEGETGTPSGETGTPPGDDDDGGGSMSSGGGTTGMPPGGESGDESGGETGGYIPMPEGDPCPALAQLYADCVPEYTYEIELQICQNSLENAEAISGACLIAHTELLACLGTVDCGSLLSPEIPFGCILQGAANDLACL